MADNKPAGPLRAAGGHGHMSTTRIIEAIIIAVLASLGTSLTLVPKLEERINAQEQRLKEMKTEIEAIRRDFYVPFGKPGSPISGGK